MWIGQRSDEGLTLKTPDISNLFTVVNCRLVLSCYFLNNLMLGERVSFQLPASINYMLACSLLYKQSN